MNTLMAIGGIGFVIAVIIFIGRSQKRSSDPYNISDYRMTGDKRVLDFSDEKKEEGKRGDPLEFRSYCLDPKDKDNDIVESIGELMTFGLFKNFNPQYRIYKAIKDNNKVE